MTTSKSSSKRFIGPSGTPTAEPANRRPHSDPGCPTTPTPSPRTASTSRHSRRSLSAPRLTHSSTTGRSTRRISPPVFSAFRSLLVRIRPPSRPPGSTFAGSTPATTPFTTSKSETTTVASSVGGTGIRRRPHRARISIRRPMPATPNRRRSTHTISTCCSPSSTGFESESNASTRSGVTYPSTTSTPVFCRLSV